MSIDGLLFQTPVYYFTKLPVYLFHHPFLTKDLSLVTKCKIYTMDDRRMHPSDTKLRDFTITTL